jgi:D-alanyl-D-alanine carboxypeptidase
MMTAVVDQDGVYLNGEKNAATPCPAASITKLMTTYITFEELKAGRLHLDDQIEMSEFANKQERALGLADGSTQSVETLILAANIYSANDAAVALAEKISGTEAAFTVRMNETAKRFGLGKTGYTNSTGLPLDEREGKGRKAKIVRTQSMTSLGDMNVLTAAILRDFPEYGYLLQQETFQFAGKVNPKAYWLLTKGGKGSCHSVGKDVLECKGHDGLKGSMHLPPEDKVLLAKTGWVNGALNVVARVLHDGKERFVGVFRASSADKRTAVVVAAATQDFSSGNGDIIVANALSVKVANKKAAKPIRPPKLAPVGVSVEEPQPR